MKKLVYVLLFFLLLSLMSSTTILAADNIINVGVCMPSVQAPAFQAIVNEMEKVAPELGAKAIVLSAEHDLSLQINQVQDFITRGVDAIIICAVDSQGIIPVVKAANRKGIFIVALDRKIGGGDVSFAIETDNIAAGRAQAQYFALTTLGQKKIKVLAIISDPTASALRERQEGFLWEVNNWGHLEIVAQPSIGVSTEKAYDATVDILRKYPDIKAIFTSSDYWVPPIWSALEQLGKLYPKGDPNHIMIASVDGDSIALGGLREGKNDAVIAQLFTSMGKEAMEAAVSLAQGKEVMPKVKLLPTITVTSENLEYLGDLLWGYSGIK